MQQRVGLALGALLFACSGLDPAAFRGSDAGSSEPEAAGWAFDGGTPHHTGGAAGATAGARGGSGPLGKAGRGAEPDTGGSAGEDEEGGAAGVTPAGGKGGNPGGGKAIGGRAGAGAAGGGAGGSGARGGEAGSRPLGGAGAGAPGAAGTGGQAGSPSTTHAFVFSEYVEGSSSKKALELLALADSNLTGCRLVTYFNGSSTGTGIALEGSVAAGRTYVLCSTQLATELGAVCQRATNLTFNGDDALELECDGASIDSLGQAGVDPGDAWGSGELTTLNHTLRRSCAVLAGDREGVDEFDPAREWLSLPLDTFDGLGSSGCPER